MGNSCLVISLDFELSWGVRDSIGLEKYRNNLLGVRSVVPALLELFHEFGIHATWATVGFLFFKSRDELMNNLPEQIPHYADRMFSPYDDLDRLGNHEGEDPFHYAPSLINMIQTFPNQEIGTHTFSHYYCLERGQTLEAFRADLRAALSIAKGYGLDIQSLVFPGNQYSEAHVSVLAEMGIMAYRGNGRAWLHAPRSRENERMVRRGLRLLDAYISFSRHNGHSPSALRGSYPVNVPASRFLRPYSPRFKVLEPLRLQRILSEMTYAAKCGLLYHLWWHPHNFGADPENNLSFLQRILEHHSTLRNRYRMESLNMREFAARLAERTRI
jgi:peptidoglycan/xylan/chitin deacetylase (PgdA/CDA1 family)